MDGGVLLLSFIAPHSLRDVPRAVKKYGSLRLMNVECHDWIEKKIHQSGHSTVPYHLNFSYGKSLLTLLQKCWKYAEAKGCFVLKC